MSNEVRAPDDALRAAVLAGLTASPKTLPATLLYDARGARLFEWITTLPEYYVTRTELAILRAHAPAMAAAAGPGCTLIELGSGPATKVRLLLDAFQHFGNAARPTAYVPVDVAAGQLRAVTRALRAAYPALRVRPVVADYTRTLDLGPLPPGRRVVFFPGSTIGNFHPQEAVDFLRGVARLCGAGGAVLLGVDRAKDAAVLHRAYNDAAGVTARFNRNVLRRLNRECGATFDPRRFRHYAFYNPPAGRVEMHLVSRAAHAVEVAGVPARFARGESIWTESSYKYRPRGVAALAAAAGFRVAHTWTDPRAWCEVAWLDVTGDDARAA